MLKAIGTTALYLYLLDFLAFFGTVLWFGFTYGWHTTCPDWVNVWGAVTFAPLVLAFAGGVIALIGWGVYGVVKVWRDAL
jgi:hypothetical protein